jgi:serine phosphatase RsbU (regulator of sigma subunit)
VPPALVVAAFAALVVGLLAVARVRLAVAAGAVALVAYAGAAVAAFLFRGVLLPVMPGAIVVGVGLAGRSLLGWRDSVIAGAKLAQELETGQLVQELILRAPRRVTWGPWEVAIEFRPYGALSGDWFMAYWPDLAGLADPAAARAVVAIGDVVGKGASASLITSAIASTWHTHEQRWRQGDIDLLALHKDLSHMIRGIFVGEQNTTLSIAVLSLAGAEVVACGAPPWQRVNLGARSCERLRARGASPLGMDATWRAPEVLTVTPRPGDVLLANTDGVLDGTVARKRFTDAIKASAEPAAGEPFTAIAASAMTASAGALPDDVTLLMLAWTANA